METTAAKRPTQFDKAVTDELAREIMPKVIAWVAPRGEPDPDELQVLEELQAVLGAAHDFDGYKLAKKLDDIHCWDADFSLVDILSEVQGRSWIILRRHVKEWVAANSIQPSHAVGDRVQFRSRGKTQAGVIVRVDAEHGTYTVQEDGRTYAPPRPDSEFREGMLIDFEKVAAIPAR